MAASMISLPMVSKVSRGGIQVIIEPVRKSGVITGWFHCKGSGRSTFTPRSVSTFTKLSNWILAFSTVSSGRGPHMPRMVLSMGTFSEVAGSSGGIQLWSARPTITCLSGSKSFHELTILVMMLSFLFDRGGYTLCPYLYAVIMIKSLYKNA